jgi:hypothetical protein
MTLMVRVLYEKPDVEIRAHLITDQQQLVSASASTFQKRQLKLAEASRQQALIPAAEERRFHESRPWLFIVDRDYGPGSYTLELTKSGKAEVYVLVYYMERYPRVAAVQPAVKERGMP